MEKNGSRKENTHKCTYGGNSIGKPLKGIRDALHRVIIP